MLTSIRICREIKKSDWGKAFGFAPRKVKKAVYWYLVTRIRLIVPSRILKIAISSLYVTVQLLQICSLQGTHLLFSMPWAQWCRIPLGSKEVIHRWAMGNHMMAIQGPERACRLPVTEVWGSLKRISLLIPPFFWGMYNREFKIWTWWSHCFCLLKKFISILICADWNSCFAAPLGEVWERTASYWNVLCVCNTVRVIGKFQNNIIH